jgi:1-deoxy-D-xylulose-5-phosphate synthase
MPPKLTYMLPRSLALLSSIQSPRDLRAMTLEELRQVCTEIRSFLVEAVSKTGGHLGSNLGAVEITVAAHRVFDSPRDPIIFDTGHQSYVHKILTGRQSEFCRLRQRRGLSGYPSRAESAHDWVSNSHASTSLSYADGIAKAFRQNKSAQTVLVVIGDGALTGGMAWEALNNIGSQGLPIVILVNDNGRSYDPTIGGIANHLADLREPGVARDDGPVDSFRSPDSTNSAHLSRDDGLGCDSGDETSATCDRGNIFTSLKLKYIGPIDGHDLAAVERALRWARACRHPVVVHCVTRKGFGYGPAESDEIDRLHVIEAIDSRAGRSLKQGRSETWTDVFSNELVRLGHDHIRVVAITAAMARATGLLKFAEAYPDRFFDVGIAEQHAVTSAAGMAMAGLHPVIGLYSTFLNRAFDQLLMDVGLHKCGVTFALDRAGVTGPDGASHHGMWDMSLLQLVPGLRLGAPRDATRLRAQLAEALEIDDGPSVIRYPKGPVISDIEPVGQVGGVDVLFQNRTSTVLLVAYGQMVSVGLGAGHLLAMRGIASTVIDPIWALPINRTLIDLAASSQLVVTVEDGGVVGGCGSRLSQELSAAGVATPVFPCGLAQSFLDQGTRAELLSEQGLGPEQIARAVEGRLSSMRWYRGGWRITK